METRYHSTPRAASMSGYRTDQINGRVREGLLTPAVLGPHGEPSLAGWTAAQVVGLTIIAAAYKTGRGSPAHITKVMSSVEADGEEALRRWLERQLTEWEKEEAAASAAHSPPWDPDQVEFLRVLYVRLKHVAKA